jgi:RecT family
MNAIVPAGNTALTPTSMESAIQLAEMMARGKLVPSHLHNSPGDCLMVIEASMRWQMSPFAVAQCTSVIQGKLMFEGKLVAAALNASGILSSRLDYDFSGKDAQRAVTVRGTLKGETKPREVTVFLADAKTTNNMWTKQPDQQLVYAGTRVWARRHAPEVMLGVYAPEEFDRAEPFSGPTLEHDAREAINAEVPLKAAAAATPRAARVVDPTPYDAGPDPLEETNGAKWLRNLDVLLANAQSQSEVVEIGGHRRVRDATRDAPLDVKRRISELLANAYARFPEEPEAADLPEVEIVGESKVMAG